MTTDPNIFDDRSFTDVMELGGRVTLALDCENGWDTNHPLITAGRMATIKARALIAEGHGQWKRV